MNDVMYSTALNLMDEYMSPVDFAKKYHLSYIHDKENDLYIMYSREDILEGFKLLRSNLKAFDDEDMKAFKGTKADLSAKIDKAETISIDLIDNHIEEIFSYVPLTKNKKFSLNKSVLLYAFDIKATFNQDYFSQSEVCLRLDPISYHRSTPNVLSSFYYYDNMLILEINDDCSYTSKKRPENMFDDKGWHKVETKKLSYLKQTELKVGSSYLDAKDSEYLFVGYCTIYTPKLKPDAPNLRYNSSALYIRLTDKLKKQIASASTMYDFVKGFMKERHDKACAKSEYGVSTSWCDGFNETDSKKFHTLSNTFFDSDHIGYDKPMPYEFKDFDYSSSDMSVITKTIDITFGEKPFYDDPSQKGTVFE